MRYVILRDDDTNALTPVDCLERLYRPFLDRGLPVNLATIAKVRTDTTGAGGALEGYLVARDRFAVTLKTLPSGRNIPVAPASPPASPPEGQGTAASRLRVEFNRSRN